MTADHCLYVYERLGEWLEMWCLHKFVYFRASDRVSIPLLGPCHQTLDSKRARNVLAEIAVAGVVAIGRRLHRNACKVAAA